MGHFRASTHSTAVDACVVTQDHPRCCESCSQEHKQSLSLAAQSHCSLLCCVWGYPYFEQMEGGVVWLWWLFIQMDDVKSDMETQQQPQPLRGEYESRTVLKLTVDLYVWTSSAHLRTTHLLPYISSRWITVSIEHFKNLFLFSLQTQIQAQINIFFLFLFKNELDTVNSS